MSSTVMTAPALEPRTRQGSGGVLVCALLLFGLPFGLQKVPGPLPLQVVEVTALLTTAAVVLRRVAWRPTPLVAPAPLLWAVGLVVIAMLSDLLAGDQAAAVTQTVQLTGGVLLAAALPSEIDGWGIIHRLVRIFVIVTTGLCAVGLTGIGVLQTSFGGGVSTSRAEGVFASPNEFGTFAGLAVVVATGHLLAARGRRETFWRTPPVVITGAALTLSLSRGAWFGAVVALLGMAVLIPRARRLIVTAVLVTSVVTAVLMVTDPSNPVLAVVVERTESIVAPGGGNPYDVRPDIWRAAPGLIADHPWVGSGLGSFEQRFQTLFYTAYPDVVVHAHNLLLTVGVELGVPAMVLLIGLAGHLWWATYRTVRRLRSEGRAADAALVAGLGMALVVLAGQGVVDFTLRNALLVLLTWWIVGLLLAADRLVAQQDTVTGWRR